MAMGVAFNYGSQMLMGALGNMATGSSSTETSGQGMPWNVGSDVFGGFSNMMGSVGGVLGGSGATSSGSSSVGGSLLGGGGGSGSLGMMTQFGQSIFGGSQERSAVLYNSQMTEVNNYHLMEQGVYNRSVSYKEAQLINQDAEIKLATLRRELYRRNHSISGHKGVRLDSGSIVDVREDTIRQAAYDAEIVKYQAEVNSNRMIEHGDLSVWSAQSKSVLNSNMVQEDINKSDSSINGGLLSQGMSLAGSMLGSNLGG
ncbi:hypothetical protein [Maridesulfovibrio salexigens]|uniref:Uncharacterized protein n=1 Tax=Maridesulfovibrio salexigens (strain ATCC 14822 / DSM 2638 / NCIMB 8403 / VKM B-1763) TaxID=526222 RepID=C6BRR5_MARSD|nr:hypothetical protein [Maridesulfovibrio salexigens]ACS79505.1 hypothetical protein Desal_1443 [Maridesulfovibrio salexigens DSM 2638]